MHTLKSIDEKINQETICNSIVAPIYAMKAEAVKNAAYNEVNFKGKELPRRAANATSPAIARQWRGNKSITFYFYAYQS